MIYIYFNNVVKLFVQLYRMKDSTPLPSIAAVHCQQKK